VTKPLENRPFRVLFVCLGNICRSPTAEGVFRQLLKQEAPGLQVEVDSAGTADYHVGDPPDLRSQRAAIRRGIDLSGARARQVTTDDFARFDLILAMDRDNLRELEAMRPERSRARLQLFLEYAPELGLLEVPDPYYRDARGFEEVLEYSTAASRGLILALQKIAQQPVKTAGERDRDRQRKHPGHQ
jgi:protein-tyrosine phosphatase